MYSLYSDIDHYAALLKTDDVPVNPLKFITKVGKGINETISKLKWHKFELERKMGDQNWEQQKQQELDTWISKAIGKNVHLLPKYAEMEWKLGNERCSKRFALIY